MKTSILLPILALASRAFAIPPACLLSAVNTQDDPSNLSAVCGKEATSVQSAIASLCPSNAASAAQSAFLATCSGAGSSVAPFTGTKSSSGSKSTSGTFVYTTAVYNSDCSCTTTMVATATGAAAASSLGLTASQTASATGAGQTGNMANEYRGMGSLAAAVVAVAGVVVAL